MRRRPLEAEMLYHRGGMPLGPPANTRAVAHLILRHLYDGDIIEWPIPDDHPQRAVFQDLEARGLIARWDRIWPLRDRYRLTELGIKTIEAVYRPGDAESLFGEMSKANLKPKARRAFLKQRGYDPTLWPLLHDPWTHWTTFDDAGARWHTYVWEDEQPFRKTRRSREPSAEELAARQRELELERARELEWERQQERERVANVNLDRDVQDPVRGVIDRGDYDVS
ncbi:MAG: hypothetical protein U0414_13565 [Polyangiaceae bacterium]